MARARNMQTNETALVEDEVAQIEAALDGALDDLEIELDAEATENDPVIDTASAYASQDALIDNTGEHEGDIELSEDAKVDTNAAYVAQGGNLTKAPGAGRVVNRAPKMDFADAVRAAMPKVGALEVNGSPLDDAAVNALINSVTQKKVREKVANVLFAAVNGKEPSRYTKIALDLVQQKAAAGQTLKTTDIKAAYLAAGLREGTANSQAGQMRAMLPVLRVVNVKGVELVPNPDSVLLQACAA